MKLFTSLLFAAVTILYLSSNSSGPTQPVGDRTGSPVATGTCTGCHNGGSFGTATTVTILDGDDAITSYVPGKEYMLSISIATTTAPSGFGYQAVILDGANNNAGAFGTAPNDFRVSSLNNRDYLEHSTRQSASEVMIPWTAPASGTGDVTVYAAGNSINANGGTSGDEVNLATAVLTENTSSSVAELLDAQAWKAFAVNSAEVIVELTLMPEARTNIVMRDLNGRTIATQPLTNARQVVNLEQAVSGLVSVSLESVKGSVSSKLVRL